MRPIKIVITGGPSGGKTTLIQALQKEMGNLITVAPEAASVLYGGGFPRLKSPSAKMHGQKAIYYVQRELEDLVHGEAPPRALVICDRGALDSVAYWPKSKSHFFKTLKTSEKKELKRYDWVIHLDTASRGFYDSTNPLRTESFSEAQILNEKVKRAWAGHPRRLVISEREDFLSKMTLSMTVIRAILEKKTWRGIQDELLDVVG